MCTVCGCSGHGAAIEGFGPLTKAQTALPLPVGGKVVGAWPGTQPARAPAPAPQLSVLAQPQAARPARSLVPVPLADVVSDLAHDHAHAGCAHDLHYGLGPARAHAPGLSQERMIRIETDILSHNDALARRNRAAWAGLGVLALNLMSSPGSGKTTLLCRTIEALGADGGTPVPVAVIEGDQQTSNDADRIRATGAPAIQINTGKGCHLDAQMVGLAADRLALAQGTVLFIENVGNLVCPAGFDLGEGARVAILSVTEGEDKPLKYPDLFASADLVLVNKTDLAPHCDVDLAAIDANIARVNPRAQVLHLSARTGQGMGDWLGWIAARRAAVAGA